MRWTTTDLRAGLATRLSRMYAVEVPAYGALVETAQSVNAEVMARDGIAAERLGSLDRVTAERHGAVRVGSAKELAQAGRLFAALGMEPVGSYDLREAAPTPLPVVSTAFRPVEASELATNPFRLFTSVLVPEDERFFTPELGARVRQAVAARTLFAPRLLELADRAAVAGDLGDDDAVELLHLACDAFALSTEPVDRRWHGELSAVSGVAADIAGATSTHLNHLTPRVLDIDLLYDRMSARGIEMIDRIQGPPRWAGPDVLLRQTSFRALVEARSMREPDGRVTAGEVRVRFGEVEARGIALTPEGRAVVDALPADPAAWAARLPSTEAGLDESGLAWFTVSVADGRLHRAPVVYEDFLPASAAGIFRSNLDDDGASPAADEAPVVVRDQDWLAAALGREVHDPMALYAAQVEASWVAVGGRRRWEAPV